MLLLGPAVPVVLAPVHGLGLRLPSWQVCAAAAALEIVDKYLLKVGRSREAQGKRGSPGSSREGEEVYFPLLFLKFSVEVVDFLSTTAQSRATHKVGKNRRRNFKIPPVVAKLLVCVV